MLDTTDHIRTALHEAHAARFYTPVASIQRDARMHMYTVHATRQSVPAIKTAARGATARGKLNGQRCNKTIYNIQA